MKRGFLALSALTILVYILPFLFVRVPLGYLYLDTDTPLHTAEVQRENCRPCYVRDTFFIGDARPLAELHGIYPAMAWLGRTTRLGPVTVMALWGLVITLIAVLGTYWTLRRLGCGEWRSGTFSTIILFGVQIFGGVFIGSLGGGYNTHSMAISIALVLFGIFVVMNAEQKTRLKSLWIIPIAAACMNIYPLVFPQLIMLMVAYHLVFRTVPIRTLVLALGACLLVVPVPILEIMRIRSLPATEHLSDLRQIMPYMYVENWQYFAAAARRFILPLLILGVYEFFRRRSSGGVRAADASSRLILTRLAILSGALLVVSIVLEQFSASMIRFQFSPAMAEWLFLSLFYLVVVGLEGWTRHRAVVSTAVWVVMFFFVSSAIFTFRAYQDWIRNADALRDRAALLGAIRTLSPVDALFLSDPNRLAVQIRGFAGRGTLIASKDLGKAQIDASQLEPFTKLYGEVQALDFHRDLEGLKAIARAHGADYVILTAPTVPIDQEDVVYRNASFAVIRP